MFYVSSVFLLLFVHVNGQSYDESMSKMEKLTAEIDEKVSKYTAEVEAANKTAHEDLEKRRITLEKIVEDAGNKQSEIMKSMSLEGTGESVGCDQSVLQRAKGIITTSVKSVVGCFTEHIGLIVTDIGSLIHVGLELKTAIEQVMKAKMESLKNPLTAIFGIAKGEVRFGLTAVKLSAKASLLMAKLGVEVPTLPSVLETCTAKRFADAALNVGKNIAEMSSCKISKLVG